MTPPWHAGGCERAIATSPTPAARSAATAPYDTACFHAQQAVEKYLKGLLAFHGQPLPRTHDLEELQRLCTPLLSLAEFSALDLTELSGYAVELRYDADFWPERDTASEAVALAEQVRTIIVRTVSTEAEPR